MPKLSKESLEKIPVLSKEAEALVAQKRVKEAVKIYDRALKLVPEPVERYEATTWLLVAKGDALLAAGDVSGVPLTRLRTPAIASRGTTRTSCSRKASVSSSLVSRVEHRNQAS